MSLLYLTLDRYSKYDQFLPITPSNSGGGMGEKTIWAVNTLSSQYSVRVSQDIEPDHEIVVVEPLWFRIRGGMNNLTTPPLEESVDSFEKNNAQLKIVYTSETSLMKLPPEYRRAIIASADVITSNCDFQKNQFNMMDIPSQLLCDIAPEHLYYNPLVPKRLSVVALGRISTTKNSQKVLDIFRALEGTGIERVYIGSANLWGDESRIDKHLEQEIKRYSDKFYRNIPHIMVGKILSNIAFAIFDTFHDCCSTSNLQALMSGILCFYGVHGLWNERPGVHGLETVNSFVEAMDSHSDGFTQVPDKDTRAEIESWALDNCSTFAFEKQWEGVIHHGRTI